MVNKIPEVSYKTQKIKVILTPEQKIIFNTLCNEGTWIWNTVLSFQKKIHTPNWYKWAEKPKTRKLFGDYDFEGIIRTPIEIKYNAWLGATCRIAYGGNYWKKDESVVIPYKNKKGEIKHKHGSKLVPGDKPYTPISPVEFEFPVINGKTITKVDDLDRVLLLNILRSQTDLPPLTPKASDYFGGVIRKNFKTSWQEFLKSGNTNRKMPRFKDEQDSSITNAQSPPKLDGVFFTIQTLGTIQAIDKHYIIPGTPKTYTLVKKESGYYLCVNYIDTKSVRVAKEGNVCGVDPGIKRVIAKDNGTMIKPNRSRERIEEHIERLQQRLSKLVEINNKRLGRSLKHQVSQATANELKLRRQITRLHERSRNSGKAFNHKLSTKLARTYRVIHWEDTNILALIKRPEIKLKSDGKGYDQNKAAAKTGLARKFKLRNLGQLREMTKQKVEERQGEFNLVEPRNTSQTCHCCGQKGKRLTQKHFTCINDDCSFFGVKQLADVNAAKNMKNNKRT